MKHVINLHPIESGSIVDGSSSSSSSSSKVVGSLLTACSVLVQTAFSRSTRAGCPFLKVYATITLYPSIQQQQQQQQQQQEVVRRKQYCSRSREIDGTAHGTTNKQTSNIKHHISNIKHQKAVKHQIYLQLIAYSLQKQKIFAYNLVDKKREVGTLLLVLTQPFLFMLYLSL